MSRAERIRDRLIEGVRPVRTLLRALVWLPWSSMEGHPVLAALSTLAACARERRPVGVSRLRGID